MIGKHAVSAACALLGLYCPPHEAKHEIDANRDLVCFRWGQIRPDVLLTNVYCTPVKPDAKWPDPETCDGQEALRHEGWGDMTTWGINRFQIDCTPPVRHDPRSQ